MPADIDAILRVLPPIFISIWNALAAFHKYAFAKLGNVGGLALTVFWVILTLTVVVRVLRFLFDLLRYVLLPSAAVSGLLVLVTPLSFLFVFPVSAAIFGVLLLIKS